jgi:hypothetical protein
VFTARLILALTVAASLLAAACDDGSSVDPDAGAEVALRGAFIDGGLGTSDCQLIAERSITGWTGTWRTADERVTARTWRVVAGRIRFWAASASENLHGLWSSGNVTGVTYYTVPEYAGDYYKDPGGVTTYIGVPAPTSAGCDRYLGLPAARDVEDQGLTESAPGIPLSNGALIVFYREWLLSGAGELRARYLRADEHGRYVQDRLLVRTDV